MQEKISTSSEVLAILVSLASIAIADNLSVDDQNVIGNFIVSVGSTILTIAAQESKLKSEQTTQLQIDDLNKQVALLRHKLRND